MKKSIIPAKRYAEARAIHFEFYGIENHIASLYGFKTEEAVREALSTLGLDVFIKNAYWTYQWKDTPRGRWHRTVTGFKGEIK